MSRKYTRVVVGLSSSLSGLQALRHAVDEARTHQVPLVAIRAYNFVSMWQGMSDLDREKYLATDAVEEAREIFSMAMGGLPTDVDVNLRMVEGPAGHLLVTFAGSAQELLVLGAPTGWRPLGSTAAYCVRHAAGPVVVIPAPTLQPASVKDVVREAQELVAHAARQM